MKNVGVELTPSDGADRRVGLHFLERLVVLRVEVGDLADVRRGACAPCAGLNSSWCMKNQSFSLSNVPFGPAITPRPPRRTAAECTSCGTPALQFGSSGQILKTRLHVLRTLAVYLARIGL